MNTMKRVLITGIHGFTGRYMVEELTKAGYEVYGLDSTHVSGVLNPAVAGYGRIDLNDAPELQRVVADIQPEAVLHLAAIAYVGHGDANAFYHVNLLGARNLLEALAKLSKRPQCVLLVSSANVYGNSVCGILDETLQPNPANDYALSKLAMEYMARLWMDRLPIVITRPFNYTGIGQSKSFLIPKIVEHFRTRAEVIELGNLDVSRDFSDVRAIAIAYRRLLESKPAGQIVNVSSGVSISLRQVIAMAEQITGHKIQVKVNQEFVRSNEVHTLCGNNKRLLSLIGEWNTPPLEETLQWMLQDAS